TDETATLPRGSKSKVRKWLKRGMVVVSLRDPFVEGAPPPPADRTEAPPPSKPWRSSKGAGGRAAVEERFRTQLEQAVADKAVGTSAAAAISPSGILNPVVTEVL